jgi:cell division protein FtsZ
MPVAEFKTPLDIKTPVDIKTPANVSSPAELVDLKPKITVIGVGGAGGNAVNNMIRSKLQGVQFVVCNTDAQALSQSLAERRIQLGDEVTQGLGAGSRPEVGRAAAEESLARVVQEIAGSNMVFITAGMGGGTGTGAAPVVAQAARERGILTVAVVTKPFHFEGNHRMRTAEQGIEELSQYVDTLIIIPNQNLFRIANEKTTFVDAFKMADDVLHSGVRGVTDLMMMPGLINLDFADIRAVMSEMGKAMMGTGEASGEGRAIMAAEAAISNPLLDDVSMKGAQGVLINITGGLDMTLYEVDEAANRIREEVDPDANIIFGSTFNESMHNVMRVSVVATGIDGATEDTSKARIRRYRVEPDPRIRAVPEAALTTENTDLEEDNLNIRKTLDEDISQETQPLDLTLNLEKQYGPTVDLARATHLAAAAAAAVNNGALAPEGGRDPRPEHPSLETSPWPGHSSYAKAGENLYPSRRMATETAVPQKRGFFSRLAETMRGGLLRDEQRSDERYTTKPTTPQPSQRSLPEESTRYYTEVTETKTAKEQSVHDIPAYVRRNPHKGK